MSSGSSADRNLTVAVQKVLKDSKLLEKLAERVYELMQNDFYTAQERISGYSRRRE